MIYLAAKNITRTTLYHSITLSLGPQMSVSTSFTIWNATSALSWALRSPEVGFSASSINKKFKALFGSIKNDSKNLSEAAASLKESKT